MMNENKDVEKDRDIDTDIDMDIDKGINKGLDQDVDVDVPKDKSIKSPAKILKAVLITALVTFLITGIIAFSVIFNLWQFMKDKGQGADLGFSITDENRGSIQKVKDIVELLRSEYFEELTDEQILDAIATGLPQAMGSPYTYYLTADQYEEIEESASGHYVGIGCTVTNNSQKETEIVEVYPDSPAEGAGLRTGDVIVEVDGESVLALDDIGQVAAKVKGVEGTTVTIKIYRKSDNEFYDFELTRRQIDVVNLTYRMLDEEIGYIHIKAFAGEVDKNFKDAMDDLQAQGAKDVIFDLRFNSGGAASIMLNMLDYLLPKDLLLSTIKGREDSKPFNIEWRTKEDASAPEDMRFMILLNSYSASASEFFSGALRDNGRATLFGEQTFGKGSGTSTYKLRDGSAINITIFKYYLPLGAQIEGIGLEPDILVELPEELRYLSIEMIDPQEDTVLQRAIEELSR